MKSQIVDDTIVIDKIKPYPKLMKSRITGNIFLMINNDEGVAISVNKLLSGINIGTKMDGLFPYMTDLPTGYKVMLENE